MGETKASYLIVVHHSDSNVFDKYTVRVWTAVVVSRWFLLSVLIDYLSSILTYVFVGKVICSTWIRHWSSALEAWMNYSRLPFLCRSVTAWSQYNLLTSDEREWVMFRIGVFSERSSFSPVKSVCNIDLRYQQPSHSPAFFSIVHKRRKTNTVE